MAIKLKNKNEIEIMATAGHILAEIMQGLMAKVANGITTEELDKLAEHLCQQNNVIPAFKGYHGYPKSLCVGVDDVAVHGIPSAQQILKNGEILSLDMGIIYHGFYSDHAVTVPVGRIDNQGYKLLEVTKLALDTAAKSATEGNNVGDLGYIINQIAKLSDFNVIRVMVGHGIGRNLHEDPEIPCFGSRGSGERLNEGMVIAIEAMINEGAADLIFENDGWTTRTKDGKRSAIFEHTVAVGKKQSRILTI